MTTADATEVKKLVAAELRRRQRRKYATTFITSLAASLVLGLMNGWYLMLAVGIAHAEWIPALPTIGYWWAVLLVYLLRGVFSAAPSRKGKS